MIVKCTGNSLEHVAPDAIGHLRHRVHQDELPLVIGREYVVYGLLFRDGQPWFLVCEESDDDYPKPHFGQLFVLVYDRIPPDWSLRLEESNVGRVSVLPSRWAGDPRFLEKLVDSDPIAVDEFRKMKQAIELWHSHSADA